MVCAIRMNEEEMGKWDGAATAAGMEWKSWRWAQSVGENGWSGMEWIWIDRLMDCVWGFELNEKA